MFEWTHHPKTPLSHPHQWPTGTPTYTTFIHNPRFTSTQNTPMRETRSEDHFYVLQFCLFLNVCSSKRFSRNKVQNKFLALEIVLLYVLKIQNLFLFLFFKVDFKKLMTWKEGRKEENSPTSDFHFMRKHSQPNILSSFYVWYLK